MYYTLGLTEVPFELEANQIIYIQGRDEEGVESLIMKNYHTIKYNFERQGYDFCYIPYLKRELDRYEILHYNVPYAKSSTMSLFGDDNFVLNYMVNRERRGEIPPSLLFYIPNYKDDTIPDAVNYLRGITINKSSFDGDNGLDKVLQDIIIDIEEKRIPIIHRSDVSESMSLAEDHPIEADDDFDIESKLLMREIEERIEKLKQKGVKWSVIKRMVSNYKEELSPLVITRNYKIGLPKYHIEVQMTPLPKAVFLLFLKHPEGIKFSYLPDFRDELLEIYKKVKGPFYNESSARQSIWAVTDPLNNSINEKCSRIREAFVSQFDDHLARFYYVDGKWGEAKKISLPRNMVIWEE